MKLLLVNPNQYRTPPVPPIGLEYLASTVGQHPHTSAILDLCFSDAPQCELDTMLDSFQPDIVGFTIRNIDTVIYHNNLFFLDDIRELADHVIQRGIPLVLGGAGFSFMPMDILAYIGANWGIFGPGERALPALLDMLDAGNPPEEPLIDGWRYGIDPAATIERGNEIDYTRYIEAGGLAGFQTQKGCTSSCSYCAERCGSMFYRTPDAIVDEIEAMVKRGITSFHLCDTEFNQDRHFCNLFLNTLIERDLGITWSVYLKSSPYDNDMFRLLGKSGAQPVTLTLPTGPDSFTHAAEMVRFAQDNGIRMAVDYLCGFPDQSTDDIAHEIDLLRAIGPDTVGVNSVFRLYKGLPITDMILADEKQHQYIIGDIAASMDLVRPIFYAKTDTETLRGIIGDDPLFHIEGFDRTSNYERLRS